jgi:hypothetical protein
MNTDSAATTAHTMNTQLAALTRRS